MTHPGVSVIICVRNGAQTLQRQLDALAGQVDAPPFEVVIVDNGSTDETAAIAYEWIRAGTGSAADAFVVDASEQPGICFARNVGAASSSADVLAYCDSDDVVGPHWVAAAAASIAAGAAAVTGSIFELTPSGSVGRVLFNGVDALPPDAGANEAVPFFRGCSFAITRATFDRVGGFDAGLPPYGSDDTEIGVRLAAAGIAIGFNEDMAVAYQLTRGWRNRTIRRYRAGISHAVQWSRHPDYYPKPPTRIRRFGSMLIEPMRCVVQGRGRIPTRVLAALESAAFRLGTIRGGSRRYAQRYGRPRMADRELDQRPARRLPPAPDLALIAPVRHPLNSTDYSAVEKALRHSVEAWLKQTNPNIVVIVVASQRPTLPDDPRITVVTVDFPPPSAERTARTGNAAVLRDKGSKNAIGLGVAKRLGAQHIMFADADDFVSRGLASLCARHPEHPGWTITDGWRYNRARRTIRAHRGDFHLQCGTSHIVRNDLLPDSGLGVDASQTQLYEAYGDKLERWMGSHMFIHDDLPLTALPFAGALYQVGTSNSQSGNALSGQGRPISRNLATEFGVHATSRTPWGLARAVLPSRRAIAERIRRIVPRRR
ncbi:glycosyltransferase family 2 protein [Microbacterium esteraromaticum]|uniref:glycosyltransferase family 2 protein n=1 Tax=Microbacterium esteraromaticum TaxID=57043 RepID=UPI001C98BDA2|nr:glycosyltransferase family A protein [Microbacterium esteraromaticum]MBY6060274.1 glycosyltransferase family 2 protein [Microbacterium esteraromaticum]